MDIGEDRQSEQKLGGRNKYAVTQDSKKQVWGQPLHSDILL